jgi:hypothetical protein
MALCTLKADRRRHCFVLRHQSECLFIVFKEMVKLIYVSFKRNYSLWVFFSLQNKRFIIASLSNIISNGTKTSCFVVSSINNTTTGDEEFVEILQFINFMKSYNDEN